MTGMIMDHDLAEAPLEPERTAGLPVEFVRPLVGFPTSRNFRLEPLNSTPGPFARMRSLDEPDLVFVVAVPGNLYPDYRFELPEVEVDLLGFASADEVETWVILSSTANERPTANLLGPVIVHRDTRRATQVVLADSGYGAAVSIDSPSARSAK